MDWFPVICETCHARLRVRSTRVIGEIHACPKCGSMVKIVPPAGWSPPDIAQSPAGTAGQPGSDVSLGEAAFAHAGGSFGDAGVDVLLRQVDASADDDAHAAASPAVGRRVWPTGRLALWSAGGAGLLVVVGLTTAIWIRGSADAVDSSLPVVTEPMVATALDAETTGENQPAPVAEQPLSSQPAESSDARPVLPELPPDEAVAATDSQSPTNVGGSNRVAAKSQSPSPPASEGLGAAGRPSSLPEPTEWVRLGPASSDALRTRNVAEQLALEIDAIELPQVPLARLLEMLSDMAAVPITLEPAALEMAGISPTRPVTLRAEDLTIADLLRDALAQCGLAPDTRDGQVVVVKPGGDSRRTVNYQVDDLAGTADAAQLAKMIERLVAPDTWQSAGRHGRLAVASGAGTITVDGTTLRIEQLQRVHYQVLTFCERLRLARGLATRSRYPANRLTMEPVYWQLAARLSARTTFTFLPWTRLTDVFRHWEDAAGVTMLVDWPALAELDLGPSSPVACSVADRSWNDAFDAVLAPLGLTWRAIDGQTIQITSRDALAGVLQIEFYPVADRLLRQFASPEALFAQLVDEAKKQVADDPADAPPIEIELDGPSGRLVVLGPPDLHRYVTQRLADGANP